MTSDHATLSLGFAPRRRDVTHKPEHQPLSDAEPAALGVPVEPLIGEGRRSRQVRTAGEEGTRPRWADTEARQAARGAGVASAVDRERFTSLGPLVYVVCVQVSTVPRATYVRVNPYD